MVLFVIAYLVAWIIHSGMTSPVNQVLMRGRENKKGVDREEELYESCVPYKCCCFCLIGYRLRGIG